jgi:molecular chaperone DnaK
MPHERAVGIDLGTTFSAVAWVDESGHTSVVRNTEGDLLTPSVVLFTDKEVVVGKEARTATMIHPNLVAEWVKRDMGLPYYRRRIHGKKLPPEVIQACILQKLKAEIVGTLGDVGRVVITVPAYFDEPRRKRTCDAGEMAGLKVLDIVNEPTAAALAFGEILGYLTADDAPKEKMTILVYDLGGGTFDATLLRLAPGNIETIATDGDVQLGGHDWDMRLVDYVADQFEQSHGRDPRDDPAAVGRILSAAIDAKHALSARSRTTIRAEWDGRAVEVPVTREQFEEMTADLLDRTRFTTRQLLAAAKTEWQDVDRLLLVGGSTRMPMVAEMLRTLSGKEPDHTVNPDEAVARGAALYAAYLLAKETGSGVHKDLNITNVNSHSLGVEGIDPETMHKKNCILIPHNTPLPAKFKERFATKVANQRSIAIQVLEGESPQPSDCTAIGRTVIRDMPENLPKNWPIEVTFKYSANGRLTVSATVPGTHHKTTLELERAAGMSSEGIARWKRPIEAAAGFDEFDAMVDEVLEMSVDGGEMVSMTAEGAMPKQAGNPMLEQPNPIVTRPTAEDDCDPPPVSGSPAPTAGVAEALPKNDFELPALESVPFVAKDKEPLGATPKSALPIPRWLFNLIGHVLAALLGLAIGYLVLSWLKPESFPLPW